MKNTDYTNVCAIMLTISVRSEWDRTGGGGAEWRVIGGLTEKSEFWLSPNPLFSSHPLLRSSSRGLVASSPEAQC